VVRLLRYVTVPHSKPLPTRRGVLARDRYRCGYCLGRGDTIDHVIPRSRPGGVHDWENVVAACRRCNGKKDDRLLSELGWTLKITPYRPTGLSGILLSAVDVVDPLWEPYLGAAA